MVESKNDIVEIVKVKNVRIRNKHNNVLFPIQNVLKVIFRSGESRTIDLFSQKDMTEVDYFQVEETNKTKNKILFKEEV